MKKNHGRKRRDFTIQKKREYKSSFSYNFARSLQGKTKEKIRVFSQRIRSIRSDPFASTTDIHKIFRRTAKPNRNHNITSNRFYDKTFRLEILNQTTSKKRLLIKRLQFSKLTVYIMACKNMGRTGLDPTSPVGGVITLCFLFDTILCVAIKQK